MSYVYDQHVFHYIVDGGMTFLCMATEETRRRVTFAFLEDVMKTFREKYVEVEQTALAFSLNDSFSPVLKAKMEFYSSSPTSDNIAVVQVGVRYIYFKDAILLGGWGVFGRCVVRYKALVLFYHASYFQYHTL